MNLHILFVDDEPKILDGLRRMLHPFRNEWTMEFVTSGAAALEAMQRESFDILVTDMRMSGMDGSGLLAATRERYPQMVRIVLTGQCDRDAALRAMALAHQTLTKPCDAEKLKSAIGRTFALRALLASDHLRRLASRLQAVPSLPAIYTKVLNELDAPEPSLSKIARLISQDIGMTAKIIQVVNSPVFGFRTTIRTTMQAVQLLGCQNTRMLTMATGVFCQFESAGLPPFSANTLWRHGLAVSNLARKIASAEKASDIIVENATMAGLLHDVGRLILIANEPKEYKKILERARQAQRALCDVEKEVLGASHAELGAYLLGLWGFPDTVIEAIAWHHHPRGCPSDAFSDVFSALTAVHVADVLLGHELEEAAGLAAAPLDSDYLARLGLGDHVAQWQALFPVAAEVGDPG